MARTTIRLGNEKTLRSLVNRIYVIEGRGAAALRKRAEMAVLEANPALARREGFKPGATVIVPRVPGLQLREQPRRGGSTKRPQDLSAVVKYATDQVRGAQVQLEQFDKRADEKAEEGLKRLKEQQFQKRLKTELPDKTGLLKTAATGIAKRQEQRKARLNATSQALEQAAAALGALARRAKTPRRD